MNNRAYTLIELIVVLVLVSASLLVALPSLKDSLAAYPARAEARKLAMCIEETRSQAAREQRDFSLHVDIEKGCFRTGRISESAEPQQSTGNAVWTLPEDVRIAGIQWASGEIQKTGEAEILFSGRSYAQPAVIYLLRNNLSLTLTIHPFMNEVEIRDAPIEEGEESEAAHES